MIRQVQEIFNYGEGFIEACLAFYKNNVEYVVAALAEDNLPLQLQRLDRSMGKVWVGKQDVALDFNAEDDRQFRNAQKQRMLDYDRQEEQKAYLSTMYDDDFDDQWEEVQGLKVEVGGSSMVSDLESIKLYNKLKRDDEAEDAFWDGMKNRNRQKQKDKGSNKNDDNDNAGTDPNRKEEENQTENQKQPAKPSPKQGNTPKIYNKGGHNSPHGTERKNKSQQSKAGKAGGKSGAKNTNDAPEMSKLQKRRKDKNKAKVANHNRKSGATKKMARGMV